MKIKFLCLLIVAGALFAGCRQQSRTKVAPEDLQNWETVEQRARGTTVNLAMWAGDEARNRYFQTVVTLKLKEKYGIALNVVPLGDTAEAVNKLLNEKQAGKTANGSIDAIWINGENFRAAKNGGLLWGAFANHLPNAKLYDEAAAHQDFGTGIENLEAAWQKSQFVLAYDTARMRNPPRNVENLREWIEQNPGKFTYPAPPDFTGSAFLRHVLFHFGNGGKNFNGEFDEKLYADAAAKTFAYLNEIKPFLWRNGKNYPTSPKELDKLFANKEVELTFNYSPNFAAERIKRAEFAPTVRTFVFETGTISGYNFLTVPFNAANPAGAAVVINYLQSHENMLAQAREIGSLYPHDLAKLTAEQRAAVNELPRDPATLGAEQLNAAAVAEADAAYLDRLEKDWRIEVLLK